MRRRSTLTQGVEPNLAFSKTSIPTEKSAVVLSSKRRSGPFDGDLAATRANEGLYENATRHDRQVRKRLRNTCQILRFTAVSVPSIRGSIYGKNERMQVTINVLWLFIRLGWVGLEPTTNALKGRCSTIELPTRNPRRFRMKTQRRLPEIESHLWNAGAQ